MRRSGTTCRSSSWGRCPGRWCPSPVRGGSPLPGGRGESDIRFLVLWFVVPFLLFSLMHSKRVHYILPLVPALVLLSVWLWEQTPPGARLPGVRLAATLWSALGGATLALGLGARPQLLTRVEGIASTTVAGVAVALGAAWLLAGAAAFLSSRSSLRALCALSLPPVALLLLSAPLVEGVGARRSARDLAASIDECLWRRDRGRRRRGLSGVAAVLSPAAADRGVGRRPLAAQQLHPAALCADGGRCRSAALARLVGRSDSRLPHAAGLSPPAQE